MTLADPGRISCSMNKNDLCYLYLYFTRLLSFLAALLIHSLIRPAVKRHQLDQERREKCGTTTTKHKQQSVAVQLLVTGIGIPHPASLCWSISCYGFTHTQQVINEQQACRMTFLYTSTLTRRKGRTDGWNGTFVPLFLNGEFSFRLILTQATRSENEVRQKTKCIVTRPRRRCWRTDGAARNLFESVSGAIFCLT